MEKSVFFIYNEPVKIKISLEIGANDSKGEMCMEQKDLVLLAQKGDISAQEELYKATYQRAYYLALKLLQNADDAMDILQESYIVAFRALDSLQNPEAFSSWFAQIVANRSKNLLRSRNRFVKPSFDEEEEQDYFENIEDTDEAILPESVLDQEEKRRLVLQMIDELPDDQRECVMLYYFSGLSTEQVAQTQECSVGTVKSRLNYARKKLKESVLSLEKRTDIRLHTLVPLGLLFTGYAKDIPKGLDFTAPWTAISKELASGAVSAGTGTASAGNASMGTASGAGAAETAGAASAAAGVVKSATMIGLKAKMIMAGAAVVVAAAGITAAVTLKDPALEFQDPQFEAAFAEAAGLTVGEIHQSDVENVDTIGFYEGKLYIGGMEGSDESPFIKALENPDTQWPTVDLSDLSMFTNLESLQLDFVTVEHPEALAEHDLKYLALTGVRMDNWDAVNQLHNLKDLYLLMPNVAQGSLDFSNFPQLQSLSLITQSASEWGTTYTGLNTLQNLLVLDGMTYEGASDVSFLAGMPALQWCDLKLTEVSDLSPFSNLQQLRSLYLTGVTAGTDISVLQQLPLLEAMGVLVTDAENGDEEYFMVDGQESDNDMMMDRHIAVSDEVYEKIFAD